MDINGNYKIVCQCDSRKTDIPQQADEELPPGNTNYLLHFRSGSHIFDTYRQIGNRIFHGNGSSLSRTDVDVQRYHHGLCEQHTNIYQSNGNDWRLDYHEQIRSRW